MRLAASWVVISGIALAGDEHCHRFAPSNVEHDNGGAMVDEPQFKTEKECRANGGVWKNHAPHCHAVRDGKKIDLTEPVSRCTSKIGGSWEGHGHNPH